MESVHEQLSEQFYKWEKRGRGWQVFDEPVMPEPPFRPFYDHYLPETAPVDDGRRPTRVSSFIQKLSQKLSTERGTAPIPVEPEEEPEPESLIRSSLVELHTSLPADINIPKEAFEHFLLSLSFCQEPIAFELLGLPDKIIAQFVSSVDDSPLVHRQLQAYFPEALFRKKEGTLNQAWDECAGDEIIAIEFGLEREFMFPLSSGKLDPFVGIVGALTELKANELGLFQVLFQPARHKWADSILRATTHSDGKPFFVNMPELADAAHCKVARPIFAAVVRVAVRSEQYVRTLNLARDIAGSLRVFIHPKGNALIPLENTNYPFDDHISDAISRQSRRTGMLLNIDELIGFVHLPSSAVRSKIFERESGKTKAAPGIARQAAGILLGNNPHIGESIPVRLSPDQRVRHTHIIGASGTGKSTLLLNLIRQDVENGEGIALLDPHGDLVDRILGIIPANRIKDVVLLDPSDEQYSVGFNILSAHSDLEKNLLASDLVSVFQRLSTSWGDQMGSVLNNAILAFLESNRRCTLADLRRFLIEPAFRAEFLKSVGDPDVIYYWQKAFPQLSGNKSIGPAVTRLETFLAPKPIRYMVSQTENRLNFTEIMDTGKIFLAKLSQGLLGKENSYLLGTLLVSKFQQLAMARQSQKIALRRNFWIYLDEFHNFITPSMAEILAGARKYGIGLVLAHQELRQLQRDSEVSSAVLSNPYTRICFRVGDDDARKLGDGFSFFKARDLQNLSTGEAVARIERSDFDFNLSIPLPEEEHELQMAGRREEVITASREKYATPRAEIEALLLQRHESEPQRERVIPKCPAVEKLTPVPPNQEPPQVVLTYTPVPPPVITPEPQSPLVSERKIPSAPGELGRGGAQHKAIQKRIKQAAIALGFKSVIEKQVLDGQGSVDLLLERSDRTIACEISISTTIDHEFRNVSKCLKAGFPNVAVICLDDERLEKIERAVSGSLGAEMTKNVIYYQPDEFVAHLQSLPLPAPAIPPGPKKSRGYTVTRSVPKLSAEEHNQREDAAIQILAEAMRKKS